MAKMPEALQPRIGRNSHFLTTWANINENTVTNIDTIRAYTYINTNIIMGTITSFFQIFTGDEGSHLHFSNNLDNYEYKYKYKCTYNYS